MLWWAIMAKISDFSSSSQGIEYRIRKIYPPRRISRKTECNAQLKKSHLDQCRMGGNLIARITCCMQSSMCLMIVWLEFIALGKCHFPLSKQLSACTHYEPQKITSSQQWFNYTGSRVKMLSQPSGAQDYLTLNIHEMYIADNVLYHVLNKAHVAKYIHHLRDQGRWYMNMLGSGKTAIPRSDAYNHGSMDFL